jgi:pyruvate,water dikinase
MLMHINNIIKEIKKENYHKQTVYPFAPIIYFEASNYYYINNPYFKKLKITQIPKFIVIWNESYQDWFTLNDNKITSTKDIDYIIKESRKLIKKNTPLIFKLLNKDYDKLNNKEIILVLNQMNKICEETYKIDLFFINEYFDTSNKKLLKELPDVRLELSKEIDKLNNICDKIIDAIYYKFDKKIKWKALIYATSDELINLLNNPTKAIVKFKKIENRSISFFFDGKKVNVIKGKKDINMILLTLKKQSKQNNNITGMPAFKGIVRGKVIIISEFDYENIEKILRNKKDYVLVTPMTRPEFVPYLEKAIAIVTDEGGITCHAAIVSRELKKVCIVGTKHATQILKTGDLVEVDANTGKVIIL